MHTLRNRIILFGGTLAAGLLSLRLHQYMMETCFDDKGLLVAGNLPQTLLWVVAIAFAAGLAVMLRTIGGDGSYEDNFPACYLSGGLMIAAGLLMAWAVPGLALGVPTPMAQGMAMGINVLTDWAAKFLPWLAAASMVVLGGLRMVGKKPWPILSGSITLFYMLMLVTNYRLWSADPNLMDYAYQLLAQVLLMLCSFHRTCCDAGIIQRRKLLITGLSAAVCATASLSMDFQQGFFLASALWAAGCMCNVAVLPPDPEDEEPEQTGETEDDT
jgi:hypothetical protein